MRQITQLLDRLVEIAFELAELGAARRTGLDLFAGEREPDAQRDEALLCPVVEIALEPAPLDLAGGDDAVARLAQLAQRVPPARFELGVLLREQRDRAGGLQQLGLFGELGVVDDRRGRPAVALDRP